MRLEVAFAGKCGVARFTAPLWRLHCRTDGHTLLLDVVVSLQFGIVGEGFLAAMADEVLGHLF